MLLLFICTPFMLYSGRLLKFSNVSYKWTRNQNSENPANFQSPYQYCHFFLCKFAIIIKYQQKYKEETLIYRYKAFSRVSTKKFNVSYSWDSNGAHRTPDTKHDVNSLQRDSPVHESCLCHQFMCPHCM
jgi:hypothetical protein